MACLPRITRPGSSRFTIAANSLAIASGWASTSVSTRMPRSTPIAIAVRKVSWHCFGPTDTAMVSLAPPAS